MGFVVVIQDERGRNASPGKEFKYGEQAEDGYDTVKWIGQQPSSNGRVGTFGASTPGQNQNALATLDPPYLAAMVVAVAGSDYSAIAMRQQGAYHLRFFAHQFTNQILLNQISERDPVYKKAVEQARDRFEEWLWRLPIRPGLSPFKYFPENEAWFFGTYTNSDYPGPEGFWLKRGWNLVPYYEQHADVATIYIGSWYDTYAQAQTENFSAISKLKKKTPKRLVFHPLGHTEFLNRSWAGDVEFGPEVKWDFETYRIKWYDRFVKGIENDIEKTAPVRIFVMGGGDGRKNIEGHMNHGGVWCEEQEWPLARTRYTKYYFHGSGLLSTDPAGEDLPATTYQYDPDHPVPSVGGNQSGFNPYLPAGPYDQVCDPERFIGCRDHLPLETRPDVVVFKSPPLQEPLELTGPIEVKLWAASDAPDTDFTAKLIDEYPPNIDYPYGFQLYLNKGIVRARYRASREQQEPMKPGEVYPFTIKVYPTANRFMPGHRLVVHLSSSDFPEFDRNPNTGEPLGKSRMKRIAVNTLYRSARYPSHIVLPVIP
jgi:putative CocE/NonD family hydrolase